MTVRFHAEFDDPVLVAGLSGHLTLADVAGVHTSLMKCLAEQPRALLVDLAELTVGDPLALTVLSAVARQAGRWPGTPVLFCAPVAETARLLSAPAYRRLPVVNEVEAGRRQAALGAHGPPVVSEALLPVAGSARRGRDVVTDACLRWDLAQLIAPASLVASELIGNVVDHAHTMMTLQVSRSQRYLFIAVRDGSVVEPPATVTLPDPRSPSGRGLYLVGDTAHSWGFLPASDGKVVWASLLVRRV